MDKFNAFLMGIDMCVFISSDSCAQESVEIYVPFDINVS